MNRKSAFRKLIETDQFKKWHRIECAHRMLDQNKIEAKVNRMMAPKNLKIEYFDPETT